MNFITDNIAEICSAISGLTLLSAAALRYSSEEISAQSLNRPITDEEAAAGFDSYKVIKPSRGSQILKLL